MTDDSSSLAGSSLAEAVAGRFALGTPIEPLRPVMGGLMNRMWHLRTTRGRFAVKQFNRDFDNPAYLPGLEQGWRVERAAFEAGISMPRPIVVSGTNACIAELPEGGDHPETVRVHEWIDGRTPGPRDDPVVLGAAVGEMLARLHGLQLPASATPAELLPVFGAGHWTALFERTHHAGLPWTERLHAALPALTELETVVSAGRAESGPVLLTHGDADQKNVLLSAGGRFLLIDWDWAGPANPRHELAGAALVWADVNAGDPDPAVIRAVARAYRAAGGSFEGPSALLFAGFFAGQLGWLAFNLRRGLGESLHGPDDRAIAGREVQMLLANLPRFARTYEHWVRSLRS
ncbi:MAG: phosphotransferase enzyme family protein [Dehalococcoidia bacterium]